MSEQPPNAPEQYNPHFDAKKPPAITSREPIHDPRGRNLENYLAQQREKQEIESAKYNSNESIYSGVIKEPITLKEIKDAKNFISDFQSRLGKRQLKGDDFFSYKESAGNNRAIRTIFPGEDGYPISEWQKNDSQNNRFKRELSKENLNNIANATTIDVKKFRRKYGIKWESYKIMAKNGNEMIIVYLLELPKNKKLTIDQLIIFGSKEKKEFITRFDH